MKFLIIGNSHVAVSYNMTTDDRPLLSYPSSFFHLDDRSGGTQGREVVRGKAVILSPTERRPSIASWYK